MKGTAQQQAAQLSQTMVTSLSAELAQKHEEVTALQKRQDQVLDEVRILKEQSEEDTALWEKEREALNSAVANWKSVAKREEEQRTSVQSEMDRIGERVKTLEEEVRIGDQNLTAQRQEVERRRQELKVAQTTLAQVAQGGEGVQGVEAVRFQQQIVVLNESLAKQEKLCATEEDARRQLERSVQQLRSDAEGRTSMIKQQKQDLTKAQTRVEQLTKELEAATSTLRELDKELGVGTRIIVKAGSRKYKAYGPGDRGIVVSQVSQSEPVSVLFDGQEVAVPVARYNVEVDRGLFTRDLFLAHAIQSGVAVDAATALFKEVDDNDDGILTHQEMVKALFQVMKEERPASPLSPRKVEGATEGDDGGKGESGELLQAAQAQVEELKKENQSLQEQVLLLQRTINNNATAKPRPAGSSEPPVSFTEDQMVKAFTDCGVAQAEAITMFKTLDSNSNGLVDPNEVAVGLLAAKESGGRGGTVLTRTGFVAYAKEQGMDESDALGLFNQTDLDGDGMLDYQEVSKLLLRARQLASRATRSNSLTTRTAVDPTTDEAPTLFSVQTIPPEDPKTPTQYRIFCHTDQGEVLHRYSEFMELHSAFQWSVGSLVTLPKLPQKLMSFENIFSGRAFQVKNEDPAFLAERRDGLELYLNSLLKQLVHHGETRAIACLFEFVGVAMPSWSQLEELYGTPAVVPQ